MNSPFVLAAMLGMALAVAAQDTEAPLPRYKLDPYTRNDPDAMARLGYVSYGPFPFGQQGRDPVTSDQIEKDIPYAEFLWVETAHFRIALNLPDWPIPLEPDTKKKLREEITRLREKLPTFNPKTRVLDRWLRLHLTAQRLEDHYAEIERWLGVTDDQFPKSQADVIIGRGRFMGYGPYLGMADKYLVMVTEKTGTYLDYQANYIGRTSPYGQRWHFTGVGSLFYGVATEMEDGRLKHDTALHGDLVFNVTHSLLDGFRHYSYEMPVWIREGLAHWFQRRIDPRWNSFTQNEGGLADKRPLWKWEPETRRLIAGDDYTSFSEMYSWRDFGQIHFKDHIVMWSRWDYLMSFGQEKFSKFMFAVKGRVDPKTWQADQDDLVGATRQALQDVYGLSPLNFDERWKEWVFEHYSAQ